MKPLKKESGWHDVYAGWCNVYNHYGGDLPWKAILTDGNQNLAVTITAVQLNGNGQIIIETTTGKIKVSIKNQWQIKYGKTAKGHEIFTKLILIGDNNHANPIFDSQM